MYKKRLISITFLLTVLIFACGKGNESELGQESSEQLIRRYYQAVIYPADFEVINELIAQDFVNLGRIGQPERGKEQMVSLQKRLLRAFPDRNERVDDVVVQGDLIAVYQTMEGAHLGPFVGVEPTGKKVTWRRMHIWRVKDGQLIEHLAVVRADLEILYQLGVVDLPDTIARRIGLTQ